MLKQDTLALSLIDFIKNILNAKKTRKVYDIELILI